ncbi:MAG TPA: phosphoribosyltransferase family protein [Candidatus Saccharimonadales bacterium]
MYFQSREQAGQLLAEQLIQYRYENCAVIALGDGSVLVAREIAAQLHCLLSMMLIDEIEVPGENETFGMMDHAGGFSENPNFSHDQLEEYYGEFHGMIEEQKRLKFEHMNRLFADGGAVDKVLIQDHVVILVSDGLKNGMSLEAAVEFLKPVRVQRLIIATPIASVAAVDRMHILADEIHCLGVTDNYFDTNHYYDVNNIPDHKHIVQIINQNVLNWR